MLIPLLPPLLIPRLRILYSEHNNERSNYTIHIYAYDQLENTAVTGLGAIVQKLER